MRPVLLALIPALLVVPASAQALKTFRDWTAGCDNVRGCAALGHEPEDGTRGAYLRLTRAGDPDATPQVTIVIMDAPTGAGRLRISFDDPALPTPPELAARRDPGSGAFEASLPPGAVPTFLGALRRARTLSATPVQDGKPGDPAAISLSGAAAALLFMDEQQRRLGTATALIRPGPAPAGSVPAPPALPAVTATRLAGAPGKAVPRAVREAARAADCDAAAAGEPIAARLDPRTSLWGVRCLAGAYNESHAFYTLRDGAGRAEPARFTVPGPEGALRTENMLTNAWIEEEAAIVGFFSKGRGIGDCGSQGRYAWDGTRFVPIELSVMPTCRGVPPDAWPVLMRAQLR